MSNDDPHSGLLFIIAAPSGAGKTSLVHALVAQDAGLVISVSYTTRAVRPGEIDGQHYHFVTQGNFDDMLAAGEFLEHARVFGHAYGTRASTTEALLQQGKDVILEIDWQGARQVRESYPACRSIFILPPSLEALGQRLGNRAQDSAEVITSRMHKARGEISHCPEFEFVVVNEVFENALAELVEIVAACREGREMQGNSAEVLLEELLRSD
jgi:guanylate kinase